MPMIPRSYPQQVPVGPRPVSASRVPVIARRRRSHIVHAALWVSLALVAGVATGCSSATTSTDPSPVKCQVSLDPTTSSVDPGGGSGSVTVTAHEECGWTAGVVDAAWITITSTSSGRGNGKVDYRATVNTGSAARHGTIAVNGQRAGIDQAGLGCTFSLGQTSLTMGADGGQGSVTVSTDARCPWTATSNADWITIGAGTNVTGPASVAFTIAANPGTSRTGTLTIAGQTFTITQRGAQDCTFSLSPSAVNIALAGGSGTLSVSAGSRCAWTATSHASWITITGGAGGTGNGSVSFQVAASTGPRTGTITIADQTFTVNQSNACDFVLTPAANPSVPSAGGTFSINVSPSDRGCAGSWSAAVDDAFMSWIHITSGSTYTGAQTVQYTVDATNGPVRTGTMTIAGHSFAITQGTGCVFSIGPTSMSVGSAAGPASQPVTITTGPGCAWTASSSNVPWITGFSPTSGSGPGTVTFTFSVAGNTSGSSRSGMLAIAGQTLSVTQAGCTYSVTPMNPPVLGSGAGPGPVVTVATGPTCAWTAMTSTPWITGLTTSVPTGPGTVTFNVTANTNQPSAQFTPPSPQHVAKAGGQGRVNIALTGNRQGTITIAGAAFTVTQVNGWAATVDPGFSWLTLSPPTSGDGSGSVTFNFTPGTGRPPGVMHIAGQAYTIIQDR